MDGTLREWVGRTWLAFRIALGLFCLCLFALSLGTKYCNFRYVPDAVLVYFGHAYPEWINDCKACGKRVCPRPAPGVPSEVHGGLRPETPIE